MVEYLRRNTEAVPPDPTQTYGEAPSLHEVLQSNNDAFDIPIVSLGAPTDPADAATKGYVDGSGPFFVGIDPDLRTPVPLMGADTVWVNTNSDPTTWQRRNATDDGWDAPFLLMYDDGALEVTGNNTGDLTVRNGEALVTLQANGTVTIANNDGAPTGTIALAPDGGIVLTGANGSISVGVGGTNLISLAGAWTLGIDFDDGLTFDGPVKFPGLPTADPASGDGALWLNGGVVTVST